MSSTTLFLLRTLNMNNSRKHRRIYALFAIGLLFGADEALAQSPSSTSKRSFATLLARSEKAAALRTERSAVATGRSVQPTTVTNHLARSATVRPLVTQATYGVSAASAVVPPSGYGSGRDAYVEALYPLILGRAASQSDVDYWARVLASGVYADTVARAIWNSQEHQSLVRSGDAPDIPLRIAYDRAYAVGLANCKKLLAAEARHHDRD
jgi:hypothetical protein